MGQRYKQPKYSGSKREPRAEIFVSVVEGAFPSLLKVIVRRQAYAPKVMMFTRMGTGIKAPCSLPDSWQRPITSAIMDHLKVTK